MSDNHTWQITPLQVLTSGTSACRRLDRSSWGHARTPDAGAILAAIAILLACLIPDALALADPVPGHLASMAAQLYQQTSGKLADPGLAPDRRAAAQRAADALKRLHVRTWAKARVELPGARREAEKVLNLDLSKAADRARMSRLLAMSPDAAREVLNDELGDKTKIDRALEALSRARMPPKEMRTTDTIDAGDGETVKLEWQPQSKRFLLRILSAGENGRDRSESTLIGDTTFHVDPKTGTINIGVKAAETPVRILTAADFARVRQSIFGEWLTADGDRWTFAAADGGKQRASAADRKADQLRTDIATAQTQLDALKKQKAFIWQNQETREIVQQKRFRRLKGDEWVYRGEGFSPADQAAIAKLEKTLRNLREERSHGPARPADRYDPVGLHAASAKGAHPITVTVTQKDGHTYRWDAAAFDGTRIRGRKIMRQVWEFKPGLPDWVKRQAIASWSPPNWFSLTVTLDPVTGEPGLSGEYWSMWVTYTDSGMMGGGTIERIDRPNARKLELRRDIPVRRFSIGKISIEDKDQINRETDAARHLLTAQNLLKSDLKLLAEQQAAFEKQEKKYWQTYRDQQARLRPLRQVYEAAILPLMKAEKARAAARQGEAGADRQSIRKRIDQIDRHVALLPSTFTGPNAARYTAERRKALLAERAELEAKLGAVSAQTPPQTEQQLRDASQSAKELHEKWQAAKRDSHRIMARAGRDLDSAGKLRDDDEKNVARDEAALDKATQEWNSSQRDKSVRLAQISSDDFRARFLSDRPDFAALNGLINELRAALGATEAAHDAARRRMLSQADVVEEASNELLHSAYKSLAGQAALELADEAKNLFEAGEEGGPYAVLAQAFTDTAWNSFSPPNYYDTQPQGLKATDTSTVWNAAMGAGQSAAGHGAKIAGTQGLAPLAGKLAELVPGVPRFLNSHPLPGETAIREAGQSVRQVLTTPRHPPAAFREAVQGLRETLAERLAGLSLVTTALDRPALKAAARGFAKTMGSQLAKGLLKGAATAVAKDVAKREIAQMVEGPALSRYIAEQMYLSNTVRVMFNTSSMADDLRQALATAEETRNNLLKQYDSASGAYVEKNRQFLAQAGYSFYLYPNDDGTRTDKTGVSGQLKARVFLQGIELKQEPSPHDIKFVIRPEDVAKFNTPDLPEKLAMTIKLQ